MSTNKPKDFYILNRIHTRGMEECTGRKSILEARETPWPLYEGSEKLHEDQIHVCTVLPTPETPIEIEKAILDECGSHEHSWTYEMFKLGAKKIGPLYAANTARVCLEILREAKEVDPDHECLECSVDYLEEKLLERGIL